MCVHSLITRLQLTKMSVMYESAHVAITFQLLEISSIATHNQKQFRIFAQGTFFKVFLGKISAILPICIMKKINLEVTFKRYRFGYWNSCKRLPNFVNVAALIHRCFNNNKYQNQTYIMFSFTFLIIIIGLKMIIPGLLRLKESNTISPYICYM